MVLRPIKSQLKHDIKALNGIVKEETVRKLLYLNNRQAYRYNINLLLIILLIIAVILLGYYWFDKKEVGQKELKQNRMYPKSFW